MAKNPEKKFVHFIPEPDLGRPDQDDQEVDEGMLLGEMIDSIDGMLGILDKAQVLMSNSSIQEVRDDLRKIQTKAARLASTMVNNIEIIEHVVPTTEPKGN